MKLIITALTFLITNLMIEPAHAFDEQALKIESDGHTLFGSLSSPKDADTVLLLVAGSGPTDRNGNNPQMTNNAYQMIAEALFDAGYATLRYDKRGIGESTQQKADMASLRIDHYIDDAGAWVDLLSQTYPNVIMLGHSIGGMMSLKVAQKKKVQALITLAGMASSGHTTLQRQLSDQPPFVKEAALPLLSRLSQGEAIPEADVPPYLMSLFHPSLQGFVQSFLHVEPEDEIKKLNMPILVIIGDTDIQVTVEESQAMAEANDKAQFKKITGMNHVLKAAPADKMANMKTYNAPDLPLHEGLMPTILGFLKQL